ncbi:hypothetical protein ACOMHN_026705 [Nucella lapillus]
MDLSVCGPLCVQALQNYQEECDQKCQKAQDDFDNLAKELKEEEEAEEGNNNPENTVIPTITTNGPVAETITNGPIENGPVENGPVENGPVENGPVENGQVENGPVENGPVENGPVVGNGPVANASGGKSISLTAADMETAFSKPVPAGTSSHRVGVARGRGRGRSTRSPQTETTPKVDSDTASHNKHTGQTQHSANTRLVEGACSASPGQFEDLEPKTLSTKSPQRVQGSPVPSTPPGEKATTSDKENSCSPVTRRSRRGVFNSVIMSQIHNHLKKGEKERSSVRPAQSLDGLNKLSSPATRSASPLVSSELKIQIPGSRDASSAGCRVVPFERLLAEGRPRSFTDPVSPSSSGDLDKGHKADGQTHSSGLPWVSQATQLKEPSASSVSPPLPRTKPKGRGRGRGRARNKHPEMESPSRPGAAPEPSSHSGAAPKDDCSPDLSQSSDRNGKNHQQFSDASHPTATTSSSGTSKEGAHFSAGDPGGSVASGNTSRRSSGEEKSSHGKSGNKGLTLKIERREESPVAQPPDVRSPESEDITQLLSPNHQYTLDWAAAMETPSPTADSDPPHWNV